jgi:flavin reductase (DIM6/NTAB) family NADH-FMN oxidoreductase RutF
VKHVPEVFKRRLRALPQWVAIGSDYPQELVRVSLVAANSQVDVTNNQVIAALRPLTVAIGLDTLSQQGLEHDVAPTLKLFDRCTDSLIGSLQLNHKTTISAEGAYVGLYDVEASHQRCVRGPYRAWNRWLQGRNAARNTNAANFSMPPDALQQIMTFYICPRPVVLVSVDDGHHSNIFPMDLIGALAPTLFTLALRTTSRSVETMKAFRKVALSDIAATDVTIAYKLGNHHKQESVDWSSLPFGIARSTTFSLPVPLIALRVRELEVVHYETVGSHTFFICRTITDQRVRDAPQLCHTSGLYEHFRLRKRLPLRA